MRFPAVARSRLVHFAVLGGALFALAPSATPSIHIDASTVAAARDARARELGVERLSPDEDARVAARLAEDAVLASEARRLGLDDDVVVRRRLVQKMLFLAEDEADARADVTDADARAAFAASPSRWVRPESVRLVHVFSSTLAGARALAPTLANTTVAEDAPAPALGEPFGFARTVDGTRAEIAAHYGDAFADAAFALTPGSWSAPVASRYGYHLVDVVAHRSAQPARYEDVKDAVAADVRDRRRRAAVQRAVDAALARYRVDIDGAPLAAILDGRPAPAREPLRTSPSAED